MKWGFLASRSTFIRNLSSSHQLNQSVRAAFDNLAYLLPLLLPLQLPLHPSQKHMSDESNTGNIPSRFPRFPTETFTVFFHSFSHVQTLSLLSRLVWICSFLDVFRPQKFLKNQLILSGSTAIFIQYLKLPSLFRAQLFKGSKFLTRHLQLSIQKQLSQTRLVQF